MREYVANQDARLPRNVGAEKPSDLDALWADFLVTGDYAPVARLLDLFDRSPELLRERIGQWLKKNALGRQRESVLTTLMQLNLIEPNTKDQLVKGNLEIALIHDAKGRYKQYALVWAIELAVKEFNFTQTELESGLLLLGAASWSLQSNLKQHPRLAELLKEQYRKRQGTSQVLIKKWLRVDEYQVRLGPDLQELQGTWQCTAWQDDGSKEDPKLTAEAIKYIRWTFEEDEVSMTKAFTVTIDGKMEVRGQGGTNHATFTIDSVGSPKAMTLTMLATGVVSRGIYKVEGDILTFCMKKDDDTPPASFSAGRGTNCVLKTLKKESKKVGAADSIGQPAWREICPLPAARGKGPTEVTVVVQRWSYTYPFADVPRLGPVPTYQWDSISGNVSMATQSRSRGPRCLPRLSRGNAT